MRLLTIQPIREVIMTELIYSPENPRTELYKITFIPDRKMLLSVFVGLKIKLILIVLKNT